MQHSKARLHDQANLRQVWFQASYRIGVQSMDLVAQQYGEVNRALNSKLKRALDPAGVIAPGKSGIV